jgi:hypothetical protein
MKIESLHISMRVRHPMYGTGTVKALTEHTATVQFDEGSRRELDPDAGGLEPAEARAALGGLELPLADLLRQCAEATVTALGIEKPATVVSQLATRWRGGKLVLHPADPTLQTKEVEIEVFFHKIVMMRNNLRVLEQKLNTSETLSAADKFDWQQYVTRCYGSMTTFNVLFKDKEDQF